MDRITGPNYALVGGLRMWADRNPGTGTAGTFGNAAWFNGVQEELLSILSTANVPPNANYNNQVVNALVLLFGGSGSLVPNGWQRLAGGLIIQWGSGATVTGNQDQVFFPVAFPNQLFCVVATEGHAAGWGSPPQPTVYGATTVLGTAAGRASFNVSAALFPRGGGAPNYSAPSDYNFVALGI